MQGEIKDSQIVYFHVDYILHEISLNVFSDNNYLPHCNRVINVT